MADTKVTALTAATSASTDDLLYLVDDPLGTPTSKKITFANVQASLSAINANQIADGSVSSTEFQYIGGLTSDAQTQLDAKQPLDSDLTTIAGLTATTDSFIQSKSSAWASRTPTQVTADLIAVVGDSGAGGTKGLVPAPTAGDAAANKYLKADGTWATVAGGVSDGDKGDVTVSGTGTTWTIDNDVVTYAKMQNVSATDMVLGRSTSGAGDVEEIACTAAGRALIDDSTIFAQKTTLGIIYGYKTSADQTTTSATAVDATDMVFAIGANETWMVTFHLGVTASNIAGHKFAITVPSGATLGGYAAGNPTTFPVISVSGTLTISVVTVSATGCQVHALIQNGANAGNVQLQFASGDGVVSCVLKQNQCFFIAHRVA